MRVVLLKECLSPSAASMIALFAFHHSPPFGAVRHLLTVAEALHFTRVAQKLYLGAAQTVTGNQPITVYTPPY
jgi:hypothetical protein